MENKKLLYKTRGNSSPNKKQKIYFTSHNEDFDIYFEEIAREILHIHDVAIWYKNFNIENEEDHLLDLSQMNLFVIPITYELLTTSNYTLDIEYKFAIDKHIPILPILLEEGLVDLFNQRCGDIQYLDKTDKDITSISYDEKLKNYLDSIIIGDELTEKVKSAFDGHIFLSYRKKDRKYAQELMELIHSNEALRDIGIWYDEFLTLGEDFNEEIIDVLEKSDLFTLVVTPHLLEEPNYVMEKEFPKAKEFNKKILPAEKQETNILELKEKYREIPPLVNGNNLDDLSKKIIELLEARVTKIDEEDPEHIYLIGLAYLKGINVEVNHKIALDLITKAAEKDYIEAVEKLISMYHNGEGIKIDYDKEIDYREKLLRLKKDKYQSHGTIEDEKEYIWTLIELGDAYNFIRKINKAQESYREAYDFCEKQYNKNSTKEIKRNFLVCLDRLGNFEESLDHYDQSEFYNQRYLEVAHSLVDSYSEKYDYDNLLLGYLKFGDNLRKRERIRDAFMNFYDALTISQEYTTKRNDIEKRRIISYIYERLGYTVQNVKKERKYYMKAMEIRERIDVELPTLESKTELIQIYNCMGDIETELGNIETAFLYYNKAKEISLPIVDKYNSIDSKIQLSKIYQNIGKLLCDERKHNEALKLYNKSLKLLNEIDNLSPTMESKKNLVEVYDKLGDNFLYDGHLNKALKKYLEALEIVEKISKRNNTSGLKRLFSNCYEKIGNIYYYFEEMEIAMENYNKSLKIRENLNQIEDSLESKRGLIVSYQRIGNVYSALSNYKEAMKYYKHFFSLGKEIFQADPSLDSQKILSIAYDQIGTENWNLTNYEEALNNYNEALKINKKIFKRCNSLDNLISIANNYENIANVKSSQGHKKIAQRYYNTALKIIEEALEENHVLELFESQGNLYYKLSLLEKRENKEKLLLKAYDIYDFLTKNYSEYEIYHQRKLDLEIMIKNV